MLSDEEKELLFLSAERTARDVVALCDEHENDSAWQWRPDARDHRRLSRAVIAMLADLRSMRAVAQSLMDAAVRAGQEQARRGHGGQHVSFHGDFANATPSVLTRIEWYARQMGAIRKETP